MLAVKFLMSTAVNFPSFVTLCDELLSAGLYVIIYSMILPLRFFGGRQVIVIVSWLTDVTVTLSTVPGTKQQTIINKNKLTNQHPKETKTQKYVEHITKHYPQENKKNYYASREKKKVWEGEKFTRNAPLTFHQSSLTISYSRKKALYKHQYQIFQHKQ